MKTVLVTTEVPIQTGGIGTFVWNFAKLLRSSGEDVHIIVANPTTKPLKDWAGRFKDLGITVASVFSSPMEVPSGYTWYERVAEATAAMVPQDAGVVYLADWQAKGFDFVRRLRYTGDRRPAVVTVLHGCTKWLREGNRVLPDNEEALWLDFAEAYVAEHSDYVVAPGHYMMEWVQHNGWKLPAESQRRVLGYPFLPSAAQPQQVVAQHVVRRAAISQVLPGTSGIVAQGEPRPVALAVPAHSLTNVVSNAGSVESNCPTMHDHSHGSHDAIGAIQNTIAQDMPSSGQERSASSVAPRFKRIVFFGRLETRKGIELFISGLSRLRDKPCLRSVEEIVLLGGPAGNKYGGPEDVANELREQIGAGVAVKSVADLNTFEAQAYLAQHAADTLVIIPSLRENFPLAVIEASLIPSLNLLCSTAGSIPEVLGPKGVDQLFEPFAASFAAKVEEALLTGPRPAGALAQYDWQRANERWLDFHQEVCRFAERLRDEVPDYLLPHQEDARLSVDVVLTYYNLGDYLPYMLESLARQTTGDFGVIVIDDGSTDEDAIRVFAEMRDRYSPRGWRFISTRNGGLSAARNAGAAASEAKYIIFADADDVLAPDAVARFVESIQRSGDDCLTCYFSLFRGEGWHPSYAHSAFYHYTPAGRHLLLGLLGNTFGGAGCIVRRSAFEAVGGFTTDVSKFVGFEDYEFFTRLAFAGFQLDVVPEYLLHYRVRDDGMFRTNDLYENKIRVLRVYEERLREVGLEGLAYLTAGLHAKLDEPRGSAPSYMDMPYLINHVSGFLVARALVVKLRNQIARRIGVAVDHGYRS